MGNGGRVPRAGKGTVAAGVRKEEVLRAASALVRNVCLGPDDSERRPYDELERFARTLQAVSAAALQVLARVHAAAESERLPEGGGFSLNFVDIQARTLIEPYLLMGVVGELHVMSLLHVEATTISRPAYANYRVHLTPLGRRFVEHFLCGRT